MVMILWSNNKKGPNFRLPTLKAVPSYRKGWGVGLKGENQKIHWGIISSPKMMILQRLNIQFHMLEYAA